jgi:hypothetical protein
MIQLRSIKLLPLFAAMATACSKTPEPSPTSAPEQAQSPPSTAAAAAPAAPAAPAAERKPAAELAWTVPSSWESVPNPSPMRKATFKIKRAQGDTEDAELSVSQAGGSVDANIDRWVGQFSTKSEGSPKRNELTVNDLKVTVVEVHGTFSGSGMPGMPAADPKANHALLGAIAQTPTGALWFFKLTGQDKTITAARADFDKFVNSLRLK